MLRICEHLVRHAAFDHIAAAQHQYMPSIRTDQRQIVADQHQSQTFFATQRIEQIQHIARDPRIKRRRRFVCDQIFRPAAQRQCDRDALPLAAGELMRETAQGGLGLGQLNPFEQSLRFDARSSGSAETVRAQGFDHLRADRTQRMQGGQRILRHPAQDTSPQRDLRARSQHDVGVVMRQRTAGAQSRRQQPEQRERGETLAAAAFAHHAKTLPGQQIQIERTQQPSRTQMHFKLAQRQRHAAADSAAARGAARLSTACTSSQSRSASPRN